MMRVNEILIALIESVSLACAHRDGFNRGQWRSASPRADLPPSRPGTGGRFKLDERDKIQQHW